MLELRKDYLTENYVIISTDRGKRPHDFAKKQDQKKPEVDYFAPGNEHLTTTEIGRWPKDAQGTDWQIRWFANKFAALKPEGNPDLNTDNEFFTYSSAFGYHEVIVETPSLEQQLGDLPTDRLGQVLKIYAERIRELSKKPGVRYVAVIKNHGATAGTSILHSHSQVFAYNTVPRPIQEKEAACDRYADDPYESIIAIEKGSFRAVRENQTMVCFTPYASRFPFEVVLYPKRCVRSITEFSEQEFQDCAALLKHLLERLGSINAPYNFFLHYGFKNLRFHLVITPRLSAWGGFELSTDTIINTVSPEDAAAFYRGEND